MKCLKKDLLVPLGISPICTYNGVPGEFLRMRSLVSLLLAGVSLGGCVAVHWQDAQGIVQHSGAIRYSMIDSPSAHVLLVRSLGLDLRFGSYDPGFSLGYRKYIAVHAPRSDSSRNSEDGALWVTDAASSESGLFFKKVVGAELGFSLISNGLTVGFERTTVVVGPSASESVTTKIDFSEDNLSATRYSSKPGGQQ